MKNILFVCLFTSLCLACTATQSQTLESSNMAPPKKSATPAQETLKPSRPSMREIFEAAREPKEPSPTPMGIPTPIKDSDYIVSELSEKKLKRITLDRQPQEIIKYVLDSYHQESQDIYGTPLRKINTGVEDRDLNHDGVAERIVLAELFGDDEFPVLYVFKFDNKKWNGLVNVELGFPNGGLDDKVSFLSKPDRSDFDLMKVFSRNSDYMNYYQMQNGEYKLVECHKIEEKVEKVISCGN